MRATTRLLPLALLCSMPVLSGGAAGQGYRLPPPDIADIVDAEPTPQVSVDPRRNRLLLLGRPALPFIDELARPELRLAGLRIDPAVTGRSRAAHYDSLTLKSLADGRSRPVAGLPPDARIRSVRWSPDGARFAFSLETADGLELWVADAVRAEARRLIEPKLNGVFGAPFDWFADGRRLLVRAVPSGRGAPPARPPAPAGPVLQESTGRPAAARTYQDLLADVHDEALFEHFARSRLLVADLSGRTEELGGPDLVRRAEVSPDGRYALVETIERPFSYLVPHYRFPRRYEARDLEDGGVRLIARLPLAEEVPIGRGAAPVGPRSMGWRADAPAALHWVEARDGGDPRREAEVRDVLYLLEAPFDGEPSELVRLGLRYAGVHWGDGGAALVDEFWWRDRRARTWLVAPDRSGEQRLLFDRSSEDRYGDPGAPVSERNAAGRRALLLDGGAVYLAGRGASPEGDRPFLDRLDLRSGGVERLWRSEAPAYAEFVAFLDPGRRSLLLRRESPAEPPNYHRLELADGTLTPLTDFPHPYPHMRGVHKEVVRYRRGDGVALTATLYLPPGERPEDGPFPMLMWAYPREYKDADSAGQMRGSPWRFNAIGANGPLPFLAAGYAVFDGPTMPIVGEGEAEPNDGYVEQLVASAAAAVDEAVRRGVAERGRIAIGGHSYGAFMAANLLAHSDLFAAGLARSGAYNRTLTPFGFQAEERTFWEAPEVYFGMSPFMHADRVDEPILLIHGEADNNSGTFPLQSRRFYSALKGHGAKARLVMLPHESHGYRARESVMHTLWEMNRWLDRHLRGE